MGERVPPGLNANVSSDVNMEHGTSIEKVLMESQWVMCPDDRLPPGKIPFLDEDVTGINNYIFRKKYPKTDSSTHSIGFVGPIHKDETGKFIPPKKETYIKGPSKGPVMDYEVLAPESKVKPIWEKMEKDKLVHGYCTGLRDVHVGFDYKTKRIGTIFGGGGNFWKFQSAGDNSKAFACDDNDKDIRILAFVKKSG